MTFKQHDNIEDPIVSCHARLGAGITFPMLYYLVDERMPKRGKRRHKLNSLDNVRLPDRIRPHEQGERPDIVQLEALVIAKVSKPYMLDGQRHEMRTGMTRYRNFSGASALKIPGSREVPTSRYTESLDTDERPSST